MTEHIGLTGPDGLTPEQRGERLVDFLALGQAGFVPPPCASPKASTGAERDWPKSGYLTEGELAEYVKISPASIRRLVRREAIPYIVVPLGDGRRRTIRFKVSAIDKWMDKLERRPLRRPGRKRII
ncbi:MAG: helix-turn-helix domain-containing protein [Elusimicrobiota bacterium]